MLYLISNLYSLVEVYHIQTVCKHTLHISRAHYCKRHVMLTSKYRLVPSELSKFLDDNVLG